MRKYTYLQRHQYIHQMGIRHIRYANTDTTTIIITTTAIITLLTWMDADIKGKPLQRDASSREIVADLKRREIHLDARRVRTQCVVTCGYLSVHPI